MTVFSPPILISDRCRAVPEFLLGDMLSAGAGEMIDLALGVPELPVNEGLIAEAAEALRRGCNQYTSPIGAPQLRRAIAEISKSEGDDFDADTEITVTSGATEGVFAALLATIDPGDEVLLLEPFYENHQRAVALAGGVCRWAACESPGWRVSESALLGAIGPRSRVLLLNSPNNPSGSVLDRDELAIIGRVAERAGLVVVCDETYRDLVYDDRECLSPASIPGLRRRTIVLRSFSKGCLVSGWRLGYALAPPQLSAAFRTAHVTATCGASAPLQIALASLLRELHQQTASIREHYATQRDRLAASLRRIGFSPEPARGGVFFLAQIPSDAPDSPEYVRFLAREVGVWFVPGTAFFSDPNAGKRLVRVCFAKKESTIAEAERRLTRLLPLISRASAATETTTCKVR